MSTTLTSPLVGTRKYADATADLEITVASTATVTRATTTTTTMQMEVSATASNPVKHSDTTAQAELTVSATSTVDKTKMADADIALALTVSATAEVTPQFSGAGDLTVLTAEGEIENAPGMNVDQELTLLTASGTALSGQAMSLNKSLPALSVVGTIHQDVAAVMPAMTFSGTALSGGVATLTKSLPRFTLSALVEPTRASTVAGTLSSLRSEGQIATGSLLSAEGTFGIITGTAAGKTGGVLTCTGELSMMTASATVAGANTITLEANLPGFSVVSSTNNVVDGDYQTWVINTENGAASGYTNYAFDAFAVLDGNYYGVTSDGIYLLGGDDDEGVDIDAEFRMNTTDFGNMQMKRLPELQAGYRSSGEMEMLVSHGDATTDTLRVYPLTRHVREAGVRKSRAKPAKGIKSVYWQIGMRNIDGADFQVEQINAVVQNLTRRT